jgi:hypothetical protein
MNAINVEARNQDIRPLALLSSTSNAASFSGTWLCFNCENPWEKREDSQLLETIFDGKMGMLTDIDLFRMFKLLYLLGLAPAD